MNNETFNDVLIEPRYSSIRSRNTVDLTTVLNGFNLQLPVISANMKTITGPKMAITMSEEGGLGILHRFNTIEDAKCEYASISPCKCGVSIGIQELDKKRFEILFLLGARIFCIDVAHGHHGGVKNMLHWIQSELFKWSRSDRSKVTLIAGNIATGDAAYDLAEWGADVVKVGIGPGSVCQTRQRTGVGIPQLTALSEVSSTINLYKTNLKIIADGGITCVGDIAKALKYADAVMIGAILAGTTETPGNVYPEPGTNLVNRQYYKLYGGSASMENKILNNAEGRFIEGEMIKVPFKGHAKYILREIKEGLQSAFSYVGAANLKEFKEKCIFRSLTNSGIKESKI